jgi:virulence-associated protein VagC
MRLPKDFRFRDEEVPIRRHASAVILESMSNDWTWLDAIVGKLDEDFVHGTAEEPEQQEGLELDEFFR